MLATEWSRHLARKNSLSMLLRAHSHTSSDHTGSGHRWMGWTSRALLLQLFQFNGRVLGGRFLGKPGARRDSSFREGTAGSAMFEVGEQYPVEGPACKWDIVCRVTWIAGHVGRVRDAVGRLATGFLLLLHQCLTAGHKFLGMVDNVGDGPTRTAGKDGSG